MRPTPILASLCALVGTGCPGIDGVDDDDRDASSTLDTDGPTDGPLEITLSTSATSGPVNTGTSGSNLPPCSDLHIGALVTFEIASESLTVWITNEAFIQEAMTLLTQGGQRIPVFQQVVAEPGCDPEYTWTVDPDAVEFADVTREQCDAVPSYVEANLATWIRDVGDYCPWSARVTVVEPLG